MKGAELHVRVLSGVAVALGILMATLNLYPSWSQTAGTVHDPLLYATLFCISTLFMISGFKLQDEGLEITKIKWIGRLTLGQCFRLVSYLFGGIIIFSVNNAFNLVEYAHLVFTGAGILFGYIALMTYPETKKGHTWALIGTIFGVGGFLAGFVLKLYTTAWAEVIAALPLAIFVNYLWNKE